MASSQNQMLERPGIEPHSKQSLRLWLRMLSCTSLIEKGLRNRLRTEFQTTLPRFDVMAALDHAGEPLTMGALSDRLMVSGGNVTGIVTRLEREGLVLRTTSPSDRRTFNVALTDQGSKAFAHLAGVHEGWIDNIMGDLNDENMEVMLDFLGVLRETAEDHQEKDNT